MKKSWFEIKNSADNSGNPEILIYDRIGKDWLSDDGVAAREFAEQLGLIPKEREITVRINSPGGNVWDGMAIYALLKDRRDRVTCVVDGIAASIASVIACAGKKTRMADNALWMMHMPTGLCEGNADDMRRMANRLEVHANAIADAYAEKSGASREDMLKLMLEETWMTGPEVKGKKLCDELTSENAVMNCAQQFDLSLFRRVPECLRNNNNNNAALGGGGANKKEGMDKQAVIALLRTRGATIEDNADDGAILKAISDIVIRDGQDDGTNAKLNALADQLNAERKRRIADAVQACVAERRIPADQADSWVNLAMKDEAVLNNIRALEPKIPHDGVSSGVVVTADPVSKVIEEINNNIGSETNLRSGRCTLENAAKRASVVAGLISENRRRLQPVFNATTNTISSDVKRVVIMQDVVREFARRLLPLRAFSTVFSNVPLEGTDEVVVPFFPLQAASSTDWNATNGYVFGGTNETSAKKITVNKRKYQPTSFTSQELARQPWLDITRYVSMCAEKLAYDAIQDVLSVVTAANFGASIKAEPAGAFDSEDIIDIQQACNEANWPDVGRSLILNTAYDAALKKDSAIKLALNIGGTEVIREGQIPRIFGFDYYWMNSLPSNSENLVGIATHASAILTAFAPVNPSPGVRQQLMAYDVVVDPETGIAMNYRRWGSAQMDTDYEVLEVAYGYAAGVASALKRITSA